ncbi:hypothetical protein STVIR_2740 [Streptomyces viridochromogenes Tue57]|uniref:Uncharacterized protein n=1 Tax=Streptomyces viridochromogenes Tue57 TaxID=1160705 RepID=L8PLS3_STRVR|nr:hypothetical protein STVIR_2740 [Streptomyces viridochromogenes Tue57]
MRSLQRFVDMPTERQVKHSSANSPRRRHRPTLRHMRSHITKARILVRIRAFAVVRNVRRLQ